MTRRRPAQDSKEYFDTYIISLALMDHESGCLQKARSMTSVTKTKKSTKKQAKSSNTDSLRWRNDKEALLNLAASCKADTSTFTESP
jgi:hypothetical protein